jgi:chromatin segregation and condensation protein Rec8/ScpA/Scc1 (kleisin family)
MHGASAGTRNGKKDNPTEAKAEEKPKRSLKERLKKLKEDVKAAKEKIKESTSKEAAAAREKKKLERYKNKIQKKSMRNAKQHLRKVNRQKKKAKPSESASELKKACLSDPAAALADGLHWADDNCFQNFNIFFWPKGLNLGSEFAYIACLYLSQDINASRNV